MNRFFRFRHALGNRQMTRIPTRRRRQTNILRPANRFPCQIRHIRRRISLIQRTHRIKRRPTSLITRRVTTSLHRMRTRRLHNRRLNRRHLHKDSNSLQTNMNMRHNVKLPQSHQTLHITSTRRTKTLLTDISRHRRNIRHLTKLQSNRSRNLPIRSKVTMTRLTNRFSLRQSPHPILSNMLNSRSHIVNNATNNSRSLISLTRLNI